MRFALVLGSGGARGYAHIGVIDELKERGHEIVAISGASIGALVGGLEAAGALDKFTAWATSLNQLAVFRMLDFTFAKAGLVKADRIIEEINGFSGRVKIENLSIPFTAVASDITAEREVWFQRGSLASAIRASIAIPGFITPVMMQGHILVDGGVCNPVPLEPTLAVPSDATIAVSLSGGSAVVEPRQSLADANDVSESGQSPGSWLTRSFDGIRHAEPVRAVQSLFAHGDVAAGQNADEVEVEKSRSPHVSDRGDASAAAQDTEASSAEARPGTAPRAFSDVSGSADLVERRAVDISTTELAYQTIGTMQNMIERYRAAASPAQIQITVPYASGGTLDFHRANELIELGRKLAAEAFDRAGI
ncbi:patatin-like phospholipase family protein [Actinomycetaceae bacterium L2_0104]